MVCYHLLSVLLFIELHLLISIIILILMKYLHLQIYNDIKQRNRRQMTMSTRAPNVEVHRRKQEDNLAVVFMCIVTIFLVYHAPR